ncbi:IclR family transcriptional regulator [Zafaria cholistanensis]
MAKASDVLGCFAPGRAELALAEVTRRSGLAHATARRIAGELVDAGLLERTERGTFVVGIRLWEVGSLAPRTLPLREVAMPFMSVLNESLRQHVQLAVLEGDEAVVVERLSAKHAVGVVSRVGGRLPLHASGVGKVLLAHAGQQEIDRVLAKPLAKLTPASITDPYALARELADVRTQGFAMVREETSAGADSVAAAVTAPTGEVIAALSVVVPSRTVSLSSLAPAVVAAAKGVSGAMRKMG